MNPAAYNFTLMLIRFSPHLSTFINIEGSLPHLKSKYKVKLKSINSENLGENF